MATPRGKRYTQENVHDLILAVGMLENSVYKFGDGDQALQMAERMARDPKLAREFTAAFNVEVKVQRQRCPGELAAAVWAAAIVVYG